LLLLLLLEDRNEKERRENVAVLGKFISKTNSTGRTKERRLRKKRRLFTVKINAIESLGFDVRDYLVFFYNEKTIGFKI